MNQMNFKRELGKKLMARVVEPGMWTAATMMSMSEQVEGEPLVEIFDADYRGHVDRDGNAYGHKLLSEPLGDLIDRLEEAKAGIDLSTTVNVPQWGLSKSQCSRLLGMLREVQATYENDQTPGMAM